MNQGEMKAVLFLIVVFIVGVVFLGTGFYYIAVVPASYYALGLGIFLMAVSGLFIYREVTKK